MMPHDSSDLTEIWSSRNDPVLALIGYYFHMAIVMHENMHRLKKRTFAAPGQRAWQRFTVYMKFWLSSLYVTAKGFRELKLKNDNIERILGSHIHDLRQFRNSTFHFQKDTRKQVNFFDGAANRLNWAEELHSEFRAFFVEYLAVGAADRKLLDQGADE